MIIFLDFSSARLYEVVSHLVVNYTGSFILCVIGELILSLIN